MKKNNKNISIIIISIVILILLIFTSFLFYDVIKNRNISKILDNPNIYENIYIENINLSNLSKEDALKILKNNLNLNEKVILKYQDREFKFTKNEIGFEYDFEKSVEIAHNIARTGNEQDRYEKILYLKNNPENLNMEYKFNEQKANDIITDLEKILNKEPTKSKLIKNQDDTFEIIAGDSGLILNREKLLNDLKKDIDKKGDLFIELNMEQQVHNDVEALKMVQHKLGSYKTKYTGSQNSNRVINMKVASNNINGTVLYPNEIFSTNKAFKSTTKENGYKPATTIINGKFVDEYGGGVCQVSSTLYNAILYSELEIVERKNHSLKVGYLDYGYDATLAGDYIDLKFKNSTDYPIYIESYLTENEVICNIYGYDERPKNRILKFENALVEQIKPGPRIEKQTDELFIGEEKVEVKALDGYKYKLYKLIYIDGELKEKVLVNNSYYKPRCEEVLVGTNKNVSKPVINSIDNSYSKKENIIENTESQTETIESQTENTESQTENTESQTETIESQTETMEIEF